MIRGVTLVVFVGLLAAAALGRRAEESEVPRIPSPPGVGHGPAAGRFFELRPMTLAQLAHEAEAIVVAEVVGVEPRWNATHDFIWTENRLRIEASWRGGLDGDVVVREPGGYIAPVGMRTSLPVDYELGARLVVFLHHDALGQWRTLGAVQGRFPLRNEYGEDQVDLATVLPHVVRGLIGGGGERGSRSIAVDRFEALVSRLAAVGPEGR